MRVVNRRAHFNYELGERIEAGVVLTGAEVKSAKRGAVDMTHGYVKLGSWRGSDLDLGKGKEVWIMGLLIYPYEHADNEGYDPGRKRKLLLHRREILRLGAKMKSSGQTLVPTAIYTKSGRVKVELALARGRRRFEKREKIRERDVSRGRG